MKSAETREVHVTGVCADALDAIRPFARRHGFSSSTSDAIRFAVALAAAMKRYANLNGVVAGLPKEFIWPQRVRIPLDDQAGLEMDRTAWRTLNEVDPTLVTIWPR